MSFMPVLIFALSAGPAGAAEDGKAARLALPTPSSTIPIVAKGAARSSHVRLKAVRPSSIPPAGERGLLARRRAVHARIVAARDELKRLEEKSVRAANDAEKREFFRRRAAIQRRLERLTRRLLALRRPPAPGSGKGRR